MTNSKYRGIFDKLQEDILSRRYKPGDRFPSEAELVRRFGASRMTVFRAVKELEALNLVYRKVGSGTFVSATPSANGRVFGLLIPELGQTEIFEAICQGMMQSPKADRHSLLWGQAVGEGDEVEAIAEQLCQQYIARKVSGVFFAPIEHHPNRHRANHFIAAALDRAGIPVVLLDRCIAQYPGRAKYDLVGIDNHRAGYLATEYLLKTGARKIAFIARPDSAPTVEARIGGYRNALVNAAKCLPKDFTRVGDPSDRRFVQSIVEKEGADAFVCANDYIAGHLMHTLLALGLRIPEDIQIVGIDDVKYARLLPVPLTTMRQPCLEIGRMAVSVMLDRIAHPDLPTRDVMLGCELIVRKSCRALSETRPTAK